MERIALLKKELVKIAAETEGKVALVAHEGTLAYLT